MASLGRNSDISSISANLLTHPVMVLSLYDLVLLSFLVRLFFAFSISLRYFIRAFKLVNLFSQFVILTPSTIVFDALVQTRTVFLAPLFR